MTNLGKFALAAAGVLLLTRKQQATDGVSQAFRALTEGSRALVKTMSDSPAVDKFFGPPTGTPIAQVPANAGGPGVNIAGTAPAFGFTPGTDGYAVPNEWADPLSIFS